MAESTLYSSHIFMFPFRFDLVDKKYDFINEFDLYKDKTIDQRVNVKKIKEYLNDDWKYEVFDLKKDIDNGKVHMYNEFAYFYDYARDSIYNLSEKNPISYYFEKNIKNGKYHIELLEQEDEYTLDISGLSLRIFDSGVGILSIELENREKKQKNIDDILKINDFGRRIYPQFISINDNNNITTPKDKFLANKIKITADNIEDIDESFNFESSNDIKIGNHIMKLLGACFTQKKEDCEKYYIQPILDDRMFVLSWYGDDAISDKLTTKNKYKKDDKWYEYIFIDGDGVNVKNQSMKKKLLKKSTYDRWSDYGTLWGISRYSMVALTNSKGDWLSKHLHSMYFQMITILLATRASIIRFSDEIAAVASEDNFDDKKLTKLYKRYLSFYNRLYFKEVTHQDQGIELYNLARKQMNIDEHMEKLDNKFTKLFHFAELQSSNESQDKMDKLTIMGAIFLPPSLLVALFSMGIYDYDKSFVSLFIGLGATFASAVLGYVAIRKIIKKRK